MWVRARLIRFLAAALPLCPCLWQYSFAAAVQCMRPSCWDLHWFVFYVCLQAAETCTHWCERPSCWDRRQSSRSWPGSLLYQTPVSSCFKNSKRTEAQICFCFVIRTRKNDSILKELTRLALYQMPVSGCFKNSKQTEEQICFCFDIRTRKNLKELTKLVPLSEAGVKLLSSRTQNKLKKQVD